MPPALPRCRATAAAVLVGLLLLTAGRTSAQPPSQKKVLTHADYDAWNGAAGVTLSPDGKYLAYTLSPLDGGDGAVVVRHIPTGKETRVARGGRPSENTPVVPGRTAGAGSPQFSPDGAKVVFPLTPTKAEVEKAEARLTE